MKVLALLVGVTAAVALGQASGSSAISSSRCTRSVVDGKRVCLKVGAKCTTNLDRQYHRYGFHCHTGRLTKRRPQAPPRFVRLAATGPAEVVFDWTQDRCENLDIPDVAARAFRDAQGRVQLIDSDTTTYRYVGSDLDHLVHGCDVVMGSGLSPDPATFDNEEFITATWTPDGKTIYALVHNEYHGDKYEGQCPSGDEHKCWYNAITLAVSTDGGRTYNDHPRPKLVATAPYRYVPDAGPMLLHNPSNIVRNPDDGYFYALVHRNVADDLVTCLIRTKDLADPGSWRAWSGGTRFDTTFVDPYGPNANPTGHICKGPNPTWVLWAPTITYNVVAHQWLLVGTGDAGAYYSLSKDLITWTYPRLFLEAPVPFTYRCSGPNDPGEFAEYFALIDPASTSRNFETSGKTAYLYYTQFRDGCHSPGLDRDLMRVPVSITP